MALFWNLKLRFILAGCIVAIIGVILLIIRPDLFISYVLIIVGIIVLVIGIFWKREAKPNNTSTN
jgi:1,4-dihydroxy-2-naphthoate octaprenyltransferase